MAKVVGGAAGLTSYFGPIALLLRKLGNNEYPLLALFRPVSGTDGALTARRLDATPTGAVMLETVLDFALLPSGFATCWSWEVELAIRLPRPRLEMRFWRTFGRIAGPATSAVVPFDRDCRWSFLKGKGGT